MEIVTINGVQHYAERIHVDSDTFILLDKVIPDISEKEIALETSKVIVEIKNRLDKIETDLTANAGKLDSIITNQPKAL